MSYQSPYGAFIFESYSYNPTTGLAEFNYSFDDVRFFRETIQLTPVADYDKAVFERALQLAHGLIGISYYKSFPTKELAVRSFEVSPEMAQFLTTVYRDGLSQFVFENNLNPSDIGDIVASIGSSTPPAYAGRGTLVLQSGGKDSLLLATLLEQKSVAYDALYCSSTNNYPGVLNELQAEHLHILGRRLDISALKQAAEDGGLNGHVPITYIVLAISMLQAILSGKSTVLMAAGQEGEEPHAYIGEYAVRHQWSKTWEAERLFAEIVSGQIALELRVGSPLRGFSELKIAQVFVDKCWVKYGRRFSSCNVANYQQGHANEELSWCGECSKCANSFLLFSPWVQPAELVAVFGKNLFASQLLTNDFKGLLGIDDVIKPFECVGEIDELRAAYHLARSRFPEANYDVGFEVPSSDFDIDRTGPTQAWAAQMIQ